MADTVDRVAIVFGGAGFIGSHLMRSLSQSGRYHRIISADIAPPLVEIPGVEYISCDVRDFITLPCEIDRPDIYNLAAVHTTPGYEDWEYFWTNVLGAAHVCDFARRSHASIVVFTSSISVYGPTEEPRDESGPLLPDTAYGRSKLLAEKIQRLFGDSNASARLVIVRPAVIFGTGEHGNFTRLARLLKVGRFFYPGRKDTVKSCGYVEELVRSIRFVCDLGLDAVTYNFAYPERYTTEDINNAFAEAAGYSRPKIVMPLSLMLCGGFVFEVLAALGLKTSVNRARVLKLFNSTNILPSKLQELGYQWAGSLRKDIYQWREKSGGKFE